MHQVAALLDDSLLNIAQFLRFLFFSHRFLDALNRLSVSILVLLVYMLPLRFVSWHLRHLWCCFISILVSLDLSSVHLRLRLVTTCRSFSELIETSQLVLFIDKVRFVLLVNSQSWNPELVVDRPSYRIGQVNIRLLHLDELLLNLVHLVCQHRIVLLHRVHAVRVSSLHDASKPRQRL